VGFDNLQSLFGGSSAAACNVDGRKRYVERDHCVRDHIPVKNEDKARLSSELLVLIGRSLLGFLKVKRGFT
jgi:hypothetical protein